MTSASATLRRNVILGIATVGVGALFAVVSGPGWQDGDEPEDGEELEEGHEAYNVPDFADPYR